MPTLTPARLAIHTRLALWWTHLPTRTRLTLMVACALAIRAIVAVCAFHDIANPDRHFGDFGGEVGWVARSLALGHGFSSPFYPNTGPTAMLPPFYPWLLSRVFRIFGLYSSLSALVILLFDSVLSALTCIPIYFSVRPAAGERPAALATWLWVVYPFSIYYSAAWVWDYALTAFLFATCFCLVQRLHLQSKLTTWLGFGLLCGITALANPSVLLPLPFLVLLALYRVRRTSGPWFTCAVYCLLGTLLVLTPWVVRNYRTMHALTPVRDGFWLEFYSGNHGDTTESNPPDSHPATSNAEMQLYVAQGEIPYITAKHALAVAWVRTHPASFAFVTVRRFARFWTGLWSLRRSYLDTQPFEVVNIFFCTALTALMLLGMVRWAREDLRRLTPYLILIAIFPLTYYLTHASMDYRQPIEPEITILVAIGIFGLRDHPTTPTPQEDSETPIPIYEEATVLASD